MEDSLEILLRNPRVIGHEVGFADLTPIHDGWIREIVFGEEDNTDLTVTASGDLSALPGDPQTLLPVPAGVAVRCAPGGARF